jgi:hypothetical protein
MTTIEMYLLRPLRSGYRRVMRGIGWGRYLDTVTFAAHRAHVLGTSPADEQCQERKERATWDRRWLAGWNRREMESTATLNAPIPSDQFTIRWYTNEDDFPTCPITQPDPHYPNGIHMDRSYGVRPACCVTLADANKKQGICYGRCSLCAESFMVVMNAAPDDPRSMTVACQLIRRHG